MGQIWVRSGSGGVQTCPIRDPNTGQIRHIPSKTGYFGVPEGSKTLQNRSQMGPIWGSETPDLDVVTICNEISLQIWTISGSQIHQFGPFLTTFDQNGSNLGQIWGPGWPKPVQIRVPKPVRFGIYPPKWGILGSRRGPNGVIWGL